MFSKYSVVEFVVYMWTDSKYSKVIMIISSYFSIICLRNMKYEEIKSYALQKRTFELFPPVWD